MVDDPPECELWMSTEECDEFLADYWANNWQGSCSLNACLDSVEEQCYAGSFTYSGWPQDLPGCDPNTRRHDYFPGLGYACSCTCTGEGYQNHIVIKSNFCGY